MRYCFYCWRERSMSGDARRGSHLAAVGQDAQTQAGSRDIPGYPAPFAGFHGGSRQTTGTLFVQPLPWACMTPSNPLGHNGVLLYFLIPLARVGFSTGWKGRGDSLKSLQPLLFKQRFWSSTGAVQSKHQHTKAWRTWDCGSALGLSPTCWGRAQSTELSEGWKKWDGATSTSQPIRGRLEMQSLTCTGPFFIQQHLQAQQKCRKHRDAIPKKRQVTAWKGSQPHPFLCHLCEGVRTAWQKGTTDLGL